MKKHLLLMALIAISFLENKAAAQGMAVNTSGSSANASSMLDVSSTTKGLLIPRLTTAQMNAITSPALGLMVFNTTANLFYYFDGSVWSAVGGGPAGGDLTGTYPNPTVANGAITNAKVSNTAAIAYSKLNLTGSISPSVDLAATGTPSSSTYLRGDNTWATVSGGSGTVTSVSAGNLSPLFTSAVSNATTTPAITHSLNSAAGFTVFTNSTNAIGTPGYGKVVPNALFFTSGSADNTHFYRGDGTWQTISSGGYELNMTGQPPGTAGTYYTGIGSGNTVTNIALAFPYPISQTCTLDVFTATPVCYATYISGITNDVTGTVLKNGSSTGITFTFSVPNSATVNQVFSNVTDNTHTAVFSPGDLVTIKWDQTNAANGALARFYVTMHLTN